MLSKRYASFSLNMDGVFIGSSGVSVKENRVRVLAARILDHHYGQWFIPGSLAADCHEPCVIRNKTSPVSISGSYVIAGHTKNGPRNFFQGGRDQDLE